MLTTLLHRSFLWLRRQLKAQSFDAWTRDARQVVRHYQIRAVPTTLDCAEYKVKIVRSRIGGNSEVLDFIWPREKVLKCRSESC